VIEHGLFSLDGDPDPTETHDWREAIESVVRTGGPERAAFVLGHALEHANRLGVYLRSGRTPYRNTIPPRRQPQYPGDLQLESRITGLTRWNALAMVVRANQQHPELGGHIATYASIAELFETGFNHFFRAGRDGDLVFFQPHAAPGIYARAFLEGRLTEENLEHFRRETSGKGLSSYCHTFLMPRFWQFPNASMGLGPINAIYQARFMRYLQNRGLI